MNGIDIVDADVAVIGGGLGGIAAALAACETGARVVLTEATDRLGGQITTQAVSALDEHPLVETTGVTRSYRRLRDGIRARYAAQLAGLPGVDDVVRREAAANPGGGWVSRLCFEPAVAEAVIADLLAPHVESGRLVTHRGVAPTACAMSADRIRAVDLAPAAGEISVIGTEPPPAAVLRVRAAVVVDATELGDLLPLAGAPWVTGAEARADTGEPHATAGGPEPTRTQSLTWCAALTLAAQPGQPVPEPGGYARWRETQPFTLEVPDHLGRPRPFRVFTDGPGGLPPFWTYRRIRAAATVGGPETVLLNWASHDYVDRDLVGADGAGRKVIADEARRLTLSFVRWLQTEVPRDDGDGHGYPEIQLASQALGTDDGLAAAPYVRESRRLLARSRVVEQEMSADCVPSVRALPRLDAVGVGWYHLDLHARVGDSTGMYAESRPFTVPFSAMVARSPVNLVAAAKNIGTTHITNGAYRVHHVEWAIGEAAGVAAARCAMNGMAASAVADDPPAIAALQLDLARRGAPSAWATDVDSDDPLFAGLQMLAVYALAAGARTDDLDLGPTRATGPDAGALASAVATVRGHLGLDPATTTVTWEDAAARLVSDLPEPHAIWRARAQT
ncbi:FAD-dependent oxidoreductase [Phytoactinopolyspora alkaliphila]|uniref:FAD-dependent oxidoreductase n=1 Tax=Phytoactinopolyspora alkaliphila TaxID=1783498 RepID=A0A6N9YIM9_9ACTN|nr:FAD-dependent oxidoreductase [Phytoactinopolyspora alkaliphila]NED94901.1 FAD-dependent oxidoreductase [Phytoactinopolyspora alkaliphila]